MDTEVLKFVEGVRRELQPMNAKILNHPYLQALGAGRIERERLRLFAAQQSYIIESDLRSVALMVARARSERSQAFFLELLEGERAALKALDLFRAAVVAAPGTPVSDEPLPGAFAYCAFVAWLSLYASEAEFAGAFLINLPVWGANCARMALALRSRYGFSEVDVAFFTLFATAPPGFEDRAAAVPLIESGVVGQQGSKFPSLEEVLQHHKTSEIHGRFRAKRNPNVWCPESCRQNTLPRMM